MTVTEDPKMQFSCWPLRTGITRSGVLSVIDPNYNPHVLRDRSNPTFARELTQAMTVRDGGEPHWREGFVVLGTGAGEGLLNLLGPGSSIAAASAVS
jgi:hypothetical protein